MTIAGRCHCGNTAFEIDADIPPCLTRCTCTFCSRRGVLWAYYDPPQFRLLREAPGGVYRWRSHRIAHHFCVTCGCGTYSVSPVIDAAGDGDGTRCRVGVNARLFEGFDAATHPVEVLDDPDGYPPLAGWAT